MRQKGNGGRHCCQPPLRRAKDLPVFVTWLKPEGPDPLSILAHQLRRRFRSGISLFRETLLTYRLRGPKARWSFDRPGLERTVIPTKITRFSTALLGKSPIVSRFAHRNSEEFQEPRRTSERFLFRRLIPAGPNQNPEVLFNACRRRSDLWSPAASSSPLPVSWRGWDCRPDHMSTMHFAPESRKRNFR
jgi:hypothetical protein